MKSVTPLEQQTDARQTIRQQLRQLRRALPAAEQQSAAQQVARRALDFAPLRQAATVALFLSFDGELDTRPLIECLWQRGQQVFLPRLHPFSPGQLLFLRYQPDTRLVTNRFGIAEPTLDIRSLLPLSQLDLLLVPLVAFDSDGQRLGMGRGFYDRTLQNWKQYHFLPVGLAHDCQQVKQLPTAAWDIPLPALITPSKIWHWQHTGEDNAAR